MIRVVTADAHESVRSRSARRHLGSLPFLLAAAGLVVACAAHTGGRATAGALEAFRAPPPEGQERIAGPVARDTANGFLDVLSSPEGLERISTLVDASVTRSLEAALRESPGVHGRLGGGPGSSLVDRMARDSATSFGAAFSDELQRALGPDGRGPLAASLGATAAQVSGSAVRGARGELGELALVPGCEGEDRRACVEAEVRSLGRAAASGFVEGIAGSLAWPALALAFVVGVAATLAVRGAFGLLHRHRPPERREAHP